MCIEVQSVGEYISQVMAMLKKGFLSQTVNSVSFFRGQANSEWLLSPRLYREGLLTSESILLEEASHYRPEDVTADRFSNLTLMQHFGMPTRLLDITTNPLVALYFACNGEVSSDGAVYFFPNQPTSWSSDPLVELIMDFCFKFNGSKVFLSEMLEQSKRKYSDAVHRSMPNTIADLVHYLTIPALAVLPAQDNTRLRAQQGAFFICGMEVESIETSINPGTRDYEYYHFVPCSTIESSLMRGQSCRFIIPSGKKQCFLADLDALGINQRTLFPDLPHAIAYIVEEVKSKRLP